MVQQEAIIEPQKAKGRYTKLVPLFMEELSGNIFMNIPGRDPWVEILDGEEIATQYLIPGAKLNLLEISQDKDLLEAEIVNLKDTIDPLASLDQIVLSDGNKTSALSLHDHPCSIFLGGPPDYRYLKLENRKINFLTRAFSADGKIENLIINCNACINIETGETQVSFSDVNCRDGKVLKAIGYELSARRGSLVI